MSTTVMKNTGGYMLSDNQKNLVRLGNQDAYYHEVLLEFEEEVGQEKLLGAITSIKRKHEELSLKLGVDERYDHPLQYSALENELDYHEIGPVTSPGLELVKKMDYPFDPMKNDIFRFAGVNDHGKIKYLMIRLYALWGDSYSLYSFCDEMIKELKKKAHVVPSGEDKINYFSFAKWQNDLIAEPEEDAVVFWEGVKAGETGFSLPFPKKSTAGFNPKKREVFTFKNEKYHELISYCEENQISVSDFLFFLFTNYLSAFSNEEHLIGYLPFKRTYEDLDHTYGLVNKIFPVKYHKKETPTIEACRELSKNIERSKDWSDFYSTARENQDFYFKHVYEYKNLDRILFDHATVKLSENYSVMDKFDFKLTCIEEKEEISINLYYNASLFDGMTIDLIVGQLWSFFQKTEDGETCRFNVTKSIYDQKIIEESNRTEKVYDSYNSVLELFGKQVEINGDATALIFGNREMKYDELEKLSNKLSNYLTQECHITKGEPICILLERSEWFVISVLSALKTGAYFIPIDINSPEERVKYILEDSGARILLTNLSKFKDNGATHVISPEKDGEYRDCSDLFNVTLNREELAYCIYTSGTTGNPKGCLIDHGNILNYIQWSNDYYFKDGDLGNWGFITSVSFDLTMTSLFASLTRGKQLWIGEHNEDIGELLSIAFQRNDVDTLKLTPSHVSLLEHLGIEKTYIKQIICGGEALTNSHIEILKNLNPDIRIYNEYGPTEVTVGCMIKEIKEIDETIVIGRPISNTSCHILDGEGVPCAIGVVGELWLGGAGVSRGYLNLPELTRERFRCLEGGGRLYGTGDLARWLPSGDIEFLGRSDDQVKVRGHRIELGGISKVLTDLPEVMESVVVQGEDGDLVGYVVLKEGRSTDGLRASLLGQLPEYMVPLHYVSLISIPLTGNGKVDKGSLPAPDRSMGKDRGAVPSEGMELAVAEIWESVLGVRGVCLGDDFFELGGHSLKATRLLSEYHRSFGVRLGLRELFSRTTLESHVVMLGGGSRSEYSAIPLAPKMDSYPLSDAQRRLWLLTQMNPGSVAYNMPASFEVPLGDDLNVLNEAVHYTLERHEILRTVFREDETGEVRQWILSPGELGFELSQEDFSGDQNPEASLSAYFLSDAGRPFDLERGPLLRACLIKLSDTRHVFYYNIHHIIGDGWSMDVLADCIEGYRNMVSIGETPPATPKIQYKDYSYWQLSQLDSGAFSKDRNYWLSVFDTGELPLLDLPTDKVRPSTKTYSGSSLGTYIGASSTADLRKYCQSRGGSLFMGLVSVLDVLLYKYTAVRDVIVGTPVSGREHADLSDQIGFYVNTLALRNEIAPDDSFSTFFTKVKNNTLDSYEHGGYPFDRLVEDLDLSRDRSRSPLFDVMVTLQNTGERSDLNAISEEDVDTIFDSPIKSSKFDISITFEEIGDYMSFYVTYNDDIYDRDMVENLMGHYKVLLEGLLESPDIDLSEVSCLGRAEVSLLEDFNATSSDIAYDTVVNLLASRVALYPDKIAIQEGTSSLTYSELWNRSGRLANHLLSLGVCKGEIVSICMDRSVDYIISVLGIMRSGGAYLPIDPAYPVERCHFMLEDSGSRYVLVGTGDRSRYQDSGAVAVSVGSGRYLSSPSDVADMGLVSDDLLYVIYTSGSTGRPKGVEIRHGSLASRLDFYKNYYDLDETDRVLFYRSFSFDGSIEEYLLPLSVGGLCIVAPPDFRDDLFNNMLSHIEEHSVSKVNMPPLLLQNILEDVSPEDMARLSSLRHVVSGGDKINSRTVNRFHKELGIPHGITLYNSYGPTENTIDSTIYKFDVSKAYRTISIGSPVGNSQVYVLDGDDQLCPIGVRGEICVSGAGLAKGYLKRPELTQEKFVEHPLLAGTLMYRTGDYGRWSKDGTVEFMGRVDDQIKIRGHRIELGEIEHALLEIDGIHKAEVLVKVDDDSNKRIIAFLEVKHKTNSEDLRKELYNSLPEFMIPNQFIQLDKIPLTINGKVDKKKLLQNELTDIIEEKIIIAPLTDEEKALAVVFSEVLKIKEISVKDNFYSLGGDSIKSIQIVSRLKNKGFTVKVGQVLKYPILEDLAKELVLGAKITDQSEVEGKVLLTPIQKSFFDNPYLKNLNYYNQSVVLKSTGFLENPILEKCFEELIKHHDVLRMIYKQTNGSWSQNNRNIAAKSFSIAYFDLRDQENELQEMERLGSHLQRDLDVEKGDIIKVGHFRLKDGDRLAVIMHHLVVDGVSWRIILEDLSTLYAQIKNGQKVDLPMKSDSFQKWAQLQHDYAYGEDIKSELSYWREIDRIRQLDFPMDTESPGTAKLNKSISFTLGDRSTKLLQTNVHTMYATDMNDILLTTLGLSFRKVFGIETSMLKMEGHGREDILDAVDINRTVGWFTTTYPFLLEMSDSESIADNLIKVKEDLRTIPNKGIGHGILQQLTNELSSNVRPAVEFNFLGDFGDRVGTSEATVFSLSSENIGPDSDQDMKQECLINITGLIAFGKLTITIGYSSEEYHKGTIQNLADTYEGYIQNAIETLIGQGNERQLTPSDLTFKGLGIDELRQINALNNVEDIYNLAPLQLGMYYHWLSNPSSNMYFEQTSYTIRAKNLNIENIRRAYENVISRYAILRTSFTNDYGGQPLQIVYKEVPGNFSSMKLGNQDLQEIKKKDKALGFDLSEPSQIRLKIVEIEEGLFEFIWSSHHILMDGWCISILMNDFFKSFYAYEHNTPLELETPVKYGKYFEWLNKFDESQSLQYWKEYLEGYDAAVEIPFKIENKTKDVYKECRKDLIVDGALFQKMNNYCKKIGVTQNTFLQGIWGYLLSRYANNQDVVFGTVVSGRPAEIEGVENMIGLFINTIPVRVNYHRKDTPLELLRKIHKEAIEGTYHHYMDLSNVQSQSTLGMNLINHIMIFENFPIEESIIEGVEKDRKGGEQLEIEGINSYERTNYDLILAIVPISQESIRLEFRFNEYCYDEAKMENLVSHVANLIETFPEEIQLDSIDYLSVKEQHKLINELNKPINIDGTGETLLDLFRKQVARTPEDNALAYNDKRFTYKALDDISDRFAHYLMVEHKIKIEEIVGIKLERSEWMIITMLGILKAGACFLPIDIGYPEERVTYIKEDSDQVLTITDSIIEGFMGCGEFRETPVLPLISPENLAYIIYTSGSTGKPKGVMIEHRGIVNTILDQIDVFEYRKYKNALQFASISFDASVSEVFTALLSGNCLYVANGNTRKDPKALESFIAKNNIEIATIPPSFLKMMDVQQLTSLKAMVSAGESPAIEKVKEYLDHGVCFNAYGPTEISICGSMYRMKKGYEVVSNNIPIGKPILNSKFFILDSMDQLQAEGAIGELCVSGNGLARGYLNKPSLTKEKFISNPFEKGRIYRTGDLGRWLPDGNLEFIGRKDKQVKVNGYRIEVGEIEHCLLSKKGIEAVVVLLIKEQLVAFIVSEEEQNSSDLRKYLMQRIPQYMIPGQFVSITEIPLNTSSKIDREKLEKCMTQVITTGNTYRPAQNRLEEELIEVMANELGRNPNEIGTNDNFFDLGLNSIKLLKSINVLNNRLQLDLTPVILFEYPNISELASYITRPETIVEEEQINLEEELDDLFELAED